MLKQRHFRLPDELWKQLTIQTAYEGTTNSAKIRELIEQYLLIDEDTQEKDYKDELISLKNGG